MAAPDICLVQCEAFPAFGPMSLAGYLHRHGCRLEVVVTRLERDFTDAVAATGATLIGFSALSTEHAWLADAATRVRQRLPAATLLAGGVHPTLYPEAVLALPALDGICRGDGELPLRRLCRARARGIPRPRVAGITWRGEIPGAAIALLPRLDTHLEDREIYTRRYPALHADDSKQFLTGRGCPADCAFCFNPQLRRLLPATAAYVRRKPTSILLAEIRRVHDASPLRSIFFADDLFTADQAWLADFLPRYRAEIGLPFMCVTRPDLLDADTVGRLRAAGCHTISIGIETGSERLRTVVLNKRISDDAIRQAAALVTGAGIRLQTSNMFALPGETAADARLTISFNISLRTRFAFASFLLPFPGTSLATRCQQSGWLPRDYSWATLPRSFFTRPVLTLPEGNRIACLQHCAHLLVRYPGARPWLRPLLALLPFPPLYLPLLGLGLLLRYRDERQLTWWQALRFLWRFRHSF